MYLDALDFSKWSRMHNCKVFFTVAFHALDNITVFREMILGGRAPIAYPNFLEKDFALLQSLCFKPTAFFKRLKFFM